MKIAILTQPLRHNYGGILQNYALQTVLRRCGHEPQTIDWHNDKSLPSRIWYRIHWFWKGTVLGKERPIVAPMSRKRFLRETAHLQEFIRKHIRRTRYIPSRHRLAEIPATEFDAFLVGSDQVWLKKFGQAFFFSFLPENHPGKRYAYAASFGSNRWPFDPAATAACREQASRFAAVSVRERNGVALCLEHLGVEASHVLDPVLLLDTTDYDALTREIPRSEKKFIMTYLLDDAPGKRRIVDEMAERLHLPVVSYTVGTERGGVVPPIEKWLSGFRDAAFVITDSFHGTVLSILYNRQFLAILNPRRGADRFDSLLGTFRLRERLLFDDTPAEKIPRARIDFTETNAILAEEREKSMRFLARIE